MYSGAEPNDLPQRKRKGRNFDLKKDLGSRSKYLQIKSGPNTMNVDMVQSLNETILLAASEGRSGILGMTYGKRQGISSQIRDNLTDFNERTKIGRELWDFISEESEYHKKVIKTITDAANATVGVNFIGLVGEKIEELVQQWNRKFRGKSYNEILTNYI